MDVTLVIYSLILICALTNVAIGVWWWKRVGCPGTIHKCWVFVWGAIFYAYSFSFLARCRGPEWYKTIYDTWWWEHHHTPFAVTCVILTAVFINRIIKTRGNEGDCL